MNRIPWIWLGRLTIAGIFLAAGIPKILDPEAFSLVLFRYQLLPDILINLTALFLPWLEVISALVLLGVPPWRDAAAAMILGLLLLFTGVILINVYRGIDVGCGCFSVNPEANRIGWKSVGRNIILLILAAFVFKSSGPKKV